jgi:hypothetical protein
LLPFFAAEESFGRVSGLKFFQVICTCCQWNSLVQDEVAILLDLGEILFIAAQLVFKKLDLFL